MLAIAAAVVVGAVGFAVASYASRGRIHNQKALSAAVAVLLGALVGPIVFCSLCSLSLDDSSGPGPKPDQADITGVWQVSADSLDAMRREGHYTISTHTLTFKEDGTVEMVRMPDWWLQFGISSRGFISGMGIWEIVEHQGRWKLRVQFTELSVEPGGLTTYFYIGGKEPPYQIYDFIGDPDDRFTIVFEKR